MAFPYAKTSLKMTSFFRFFRSGSFNRVKSTMRAFREEGVVASSIGGGSSKGNVVFPFPLSVVGTTLGGCALRILGSLEVAPRIKSNPP